MLLVMDSLVIKVPTPWQMLKMLNVDIKIYFLYETISLEGDEIINVYNEPFHQS